MNYVVWNGQGAVRIASERRVLRAAELPLAQDAQSLRDRLQALHDEAVARLDAEAAAARLTGFTQGQAEGRRAAADEQAQQLLALAESAAAERAALREQLASLALQVVRKLAGQLPGDERLVRLADVAARELLDDAPVTLVVHLDDLPAVRARLDGRAGLASRGPSPTLTPEWRLPSGLPVTVEGDPLCAPGSCRLETPQGTVDASLHTQLERLEKAWGVAHGQDD